MNDKPENLISGSRLARNVLWNLLGAGAPLLVALIAIPMLIEGLGAARFGVLTLAWMVVGYFSLFDLGLGRALTMLVAEKLGKGQDDEVPGLIMTAMLLMAVLGILGASVVAIVSPWLVNGVLKIPSDLQSETLTAFYLLAASIPIVISSTGLQGVLAAYQRFSLINIVRIPLGISTFLGPLMVLPFSNSLVPVVFVLIVARLISWCVYVVLCLRVEPTLRHLVRIRRALVKPLISFGGWMTISNIVSPLMVYLDRFLIGALVSMTAVAYYVIPYEVAIKLGIIPGALMGVLFPAFAAALAQDQARAARLFSRGVNYIYISLFPIVLIIVTFAKEVLTFWLGSEFANNSTLVLQLLAFGVFINSHSQIPFGLVQGAGRPDITAKLHLIELPFYLLILWWLVGEYGIVGAAVAWVARVVIDALFIFIIAQKLLPPVLPFTRRLILIASVTSFVLAMSGFIPGFAVKGGGVLVMLLIFAVVAWFVVLAKDERDMITRLFRSNIFSIRKI